MLLGRHRGPRVAIAGGAMVVSAVSSDAGDLVAWRAWIAGARGAVRAW